MRAFRAGREFGGELWIVLSKADAAAACAVRDLAAIKANGAQGGKPLALGSILALWFCWH